MFRRSSSVQSSNSGGGSVFSALLFGLVPAIAAFPTLWWNEGRAVQTHQSLQQGASSLVTVNPQVVDPTNEGKLIYLVGQASPAQPVRDGAFGVTATALRLRRTVKMYQWVEHVTKQTSKKPDGTQEIIKTYSYEKDWHEGLVRSGSFDIPVGHENPTTMRYESATFEAGKVLVGAFTLPQKVVDKLTQTRPLNPDGAVPPELAAAATAAPATAAPAEEPAPAPATKLKGKNKGKLDKRARKPDKRGTAVARRAAEPAGPRPHLTRIAGEGFYYGPDPAIPAIGDLRISFAETPPTLVSVVGAQSADTLDEYETTAGDKLFMFQQGRVAPTKMFRSAETKNTAITWALRLAGLVLMLFGIRKFFRPFVYIVEGIPVIGRLVTVGVGLLAVALGIPLSLLTIGVAWVAYRPIVAAVLGGAAVLIFLGIRALMTRKPPTQAQLSANLGP